MAVNYVKFMRGTQALYDNLTTKDQDTLYFVYADANAEKGKLYLGNKLISGSSSIDGEVSISDIADIVIGENLSDGDVLVYNEYTQKWEAHPITEAIGMSTMIGATATDDGVAGLVPAPSAGDHLKFLRGDGTWVEVTGTISDEDLAVIDNLQTSVATLIGEDENKSVSEIVSEKVAELLIPENADESLDSLEEIAKWIQNHPNDAAEINANIVELQADVANLEELLNGTTEHPENGLVSRVSALESTMGTFVPSEGNYLDVGSAITYLNTSVSEMNDRLRWHELGAE